MNDYLNFFTDAIQATTTSNDYFKNYIIYGPITFRFMNTKSYDCLSDYKSYSLFTKLSAFIDSKCYYSQHVGDNISTDIKYPFPYKYSNNTNITHILKTGIGTYDTSGTVINLWSQE
jgi:hypothetical protein